LTAAFIAIGLRLILCAKKNFYLVKPFLKSFVFLKHFLGQFYKK